MKLQKSAVDSQNKKKKHKRSSSLLTPMIKAKSFCCIRNPLLTKLVRSRWLDVSFVLLLRFLWTETKSRSIKIQKKELGSYPAILTSCLVNDASIHFHYTVCIEQPSRTNPGDELSSKTDTVVAMVLVKLRSNRTE